MPERRPLRSAIRDRRGAEGPASWLGLGNRLPVNEEGLLTAPLASTTAPSARARHSLRWLTAASIVVAMLPTLLVPDPASAADTAAPTIAVAVPTPGPGLRRLTGHAHRARPPTMSASPASPIAIQDRASKQWLQADGSFGPWSSRQRDAALASPGATTTAWSYTFDPQRAGQFGVQAQALDAAGNASLQIWRRFSIGGTGGSDTAAPTVAVAVPTQDQAFPVLTGHALGRPPPTMSASTGVTVAIQDRESNQWLQADGILRLLEHPPARRSPGLPRRHQHRLVLHLRPPARRPIRRPSPGPRRRGQRIAPGLAHVQHHRIPHDAAHSRHRADR